MPKSKDVVLTKEHLKKLKEIGILGLSLDDEFKYVPRVYREKDKKKNYIFSKEIWPVFVLKTIDGIKSSEIEDELKGEVTVDNKSGKTSVKMKSGKPRISACKYGIKTWFNFRDSHGKLINPPKEDPIDGGITLDSIRSISPRLQLELTNAITELRIMSDEELLGLE